MHATYLLVIRRPRIEDGAEQAELTGYLAWLAGRMETLVVDGSPPEVFRAHHAAWTPHATHIAPSPGMRSLNGKAAGVNTGLRAARTEAVIIADDDVRYDDASLAAVLAHLEHAEVVRPQNFFRPSPWHALWDTARTLLNRASGGDWPGTLGVRTSALPYGYDGDVLFENLELCRTVRALGGRESVPLDLYVRRLPPRSGHFWSQRVRQAYDEFARPGRLAMQLAIVPSVCALVTTRRGRALAGLAGAVLAAAEFGRRRSGGVGYFPALATFLAPIWVIERGVCVWIALALRLGRGGVPYGEGVLRVAAHSIPSIRRRLQRLARAQAAREASS